MMGERILINRQLSAAGFKRFFSGPSAVDIGNQRRRREGQDVRGSLNSHIDGVHEYSNY